MLCHGCDAGGSLVDVQGFGNPEVAWFRRKASFGHACLVHGRAGLVLGGESCRLLVFGNSGAGYIEGVVVGCSEDGVSCCLF